MNKNTEEMKKYFEDPVNFMSRFVAVFLNNLGFKAVFEEYPLEERIEAIKICAKECSDSVKEDFNKPIDINFMERILHHFFNCVYIHSQHEQAVMGNLAYWQLLGNLIETKNKQVAPRG